MEATNNNDNRFIFVRRLSQSLDMLISFDTMSIRVGAIDINIAREGANYWVPTNLTGANLFHMVVDEPLQIFIENLYQEYLATEALYTIISDLP